LKRLVKPARITKKEAVTSALEEYVRRHKQLAILDACGTVDFDPAYDYKAERKRNGDDGSCGHASVVPGIAPAA